MSLSFHGLSGSQHGWRPWRRAARPLLSGSAAGVGSWVLDAALGEPSAVTSLLHALAVASLVALVVLRARDRRRLAWDATHDALTGLLDRRGLARRAAEVLVTLEVADEALAAVYVDLDDFKTHNDVHGHAVGDRLLVALARAIGSSRRVDLAARLGGDEFVVLLPRATYEDAEAFVARARERFARDAEALGVRATFSAGIRIVDPTMRLEAILRDADRAMYDDKRARKDAPRGDRQRGLAPEAPREAGASVPAAPSTSLRRARRWVSFAFAIGALAAASASPAAAQDVMEDRAAMIVDEPPAPPPAPPPWARVELIGGTLAPLDIELALRIVLLDRIVLGVSAGMTTYGGVAGQLVDENGGNGAGSIVSTLANGGLVGRAYLGVRPFEGLGLELLGGYTLLSRDTRVDVGGIAQFFDAQTTATDGHASLLVHALTVELGWSFYVLDHFVIRPAIGWIQAFDADVSLSAPATSAGLDQASEALTGAIRQYGMSPTVSLQLGYRW